ncbi:MAG: hypothetical protein SOU51_00955 [Collinsella sp.]|nr:hypothetical protein [Collinsella sp.]
MRIPFDKVADALKLGLASTHESHEPVRVSIHVDQSATPFLVSTIREAFVPLRTTGVVRVHRLTGDPVSIKPDVDIAVVVSCGSPWLERAAHEIVISGTPVVIVSESSVEVPFVRGDSPMLGLVCATDREHLLSSLAAWILNRTSKGTPLAANFAFLRDAAAQDAISQAVVANAVTGALFFIPGADFPTMTLAQVGMMLKLSSIYGKGLDLGRAYEAMAIVLVAAALRQASRTISPRFGRAAIVPKVLIAAGGTFAMGRALTALYARDIDYAPVTDALRGTFSAHRAHGTEQGASAPEATIC